MWEDATRHEIVEWFLSSALLVVGASLLVRSRAWILAASALAGHPVVPLFAGLYLLLAGLAVVTLHNLWVADARVVVTIVGWAGVAVGTLFLLVPEAYAAILRRVPLTPASVALRGLVRIALGGAIMTYLLSQG